MKSLFTVSGKVQVGNKRGRSFGFPTLNFLVDSSLPEGIYISQSSIENQTYSSLTFIGIAKTFDESVFQAETYVFDFDKEIYGKEVTVSLIKKIRDNQKFGSEDDLIEQMEKDKEIAKKYFNSL